MSADQSNKDGSADTGDYIPQSVLDDSQEHRENRDSPTSKKQNISSKLFAVLKDPQWWQAAAALILVPVGVYALWVYSSQLDEMRKSTQAAIYAIKLARENTHLDQRAWVAPKALHGKAELGKPFIITIILKNTGKTFAKNFEATVAWAGKHISDPDPNFNDAVEEGYATKSVALIAPDAEIIQSLKLPEDGRKLIDQDFEAFNDPTMVFYCFGKVTYTDIFKCEHWTTFCWRLYPSAGENRVHEAYNNADDNECW
jgi:hypothetical protein